MTAVKNRSMAAFALGAFVALVAMPLITHADVEKVEGFVCPVIKTENVLHSPKGGTLGGGEYYTIGAHAVSVPVHATNGEGAGSPAGPFMTPGDSGYTAIWNVSQ